MPRPIAFR